MATGLYIAMNFKPVLGGMEEHAHQTTKQLIDMGEYITVLTPSRPGDNEFDRDCGYPVTRYDTNLNTGGGWKHPLDRSRLLFEILKSNARRKLDYLILDSWSPIVGPQVVLASKILRKPFFLYVHVSNPPALPVSSALSELSRKVTLRAANKVICVSDHVRSLLLEHSELPAERVVTIINGVNLSEVDEYLAGRTYIRDAKNPILLTAARLQRCKGFDKMIEAMPRIVSEVPGTRYIIVGSREDEQYLKNLASQSPASDAITFAGPMFGDQLFEFYEKSDIFVMPSRCHYESFGIVFPEAGAFGKPAIAGNWGGQKEAILHNETGLLVDPDSSEEISEAVVRLLKDPEESRRLGQNARRRVEEELNWQAHATKLLSIIHNAL